MQIRSIATKPHGFKAFFAACVFLIVFCEILPHTRLWRSHFQSVKKLKCFKHKTNNDDSQRLGLRTRNENNDDKIWRLTGRQFFFLSGIDKQACQLHKTRTRMRSKISIYDTQKNIFYQHRWL